MLIYYAISFTMDNDPQRVSRSQMIFNSKTKPLHKVNEEFLHKPIAGVDSKVRLNEKELFSVTNVKNSVDKTAAKKKAQQKVIKTNEKEKKEVTHVAFLKVHKTASSTAQNVFLRFGDARNLSFILAHTKGESGWLNVISYNNTITKTNIVPAPPGRHFDILCNHVLYDRESFARVLPKDTVYIGIVREPISRFQSAVKYFSPGFILRLPGQTPLLEYSKNPLSYENAVPRRSQTNNRMAVEFGFPEKLFPGKELSESKSEINKYLAKLDKEFKLIIISERFDESMILMKRYLNWSVKDVLYMDQNVASQATNPRKLVPEEAKDPLRKFLHLDMALYKFAVDRFNKQVKAEGDDFQKEVTAFKALRATVVEFCKSKKPMIVIEKSQWDDSFKLTKTDCAMYHRHEKDLIQKQRMKMYGTLNN